MYMYLITAFKPFSGRPINGSQTLLNHLKCDQRFGFIEFHSLEVSWDSFDGLFESIQKRKLKGIIGLGEGRSENIRIKKLGRNYADGKDERSVIKNEEKTIKHGADILKSRISLPNGLDIEESKNAGVFLCNYELFHINSLWLDVSGFIHLPQQKEIEEKDYLNTVKDPIAKITLYNFTNPYPKDT